MSTKIIYIALIALFALSLTAQVSHSAPPGKISKGNGINLLSLGQPFAKAASDLTRTPEIARAEAMMASFDRGWFGRDK